MVSIGLVCNVYNEVNALPGWLETHTPFFDDVRVLHAGPNGEYSRDGTLEILSKWNIPVDFCSINDGFGVVRTKALRMSPCDWVMILDADERFYHLHRVLNCTGISTPHSEVDRILQSYDFRDLSKKVPNWEFISKLGENLIIEIGDNYNQGQNLHRILEQGRFDVIATIRRHWHDFTFKRPTQNWNTDPDWQSRLVKNNPNIQFSLETRMHECLSGFESVFYANTERGPFFDHFHFTFKRMEQEQRSHDVAIYDAVHKGEQPPTWEQFRSNVK